MGLLVILVLLSAPVVLWISYSKFFKKFEKERGVKILPAASALGLFSTIFLWYSNGELGLLWEDAIAILHFVLITCWATIIVLCFAFLIFSYGQMRKWRSAIIKVVFFLLIALSIVSLFVL